MNLFVDMETIRYSLFTIHYADDCAELLRLLTASVKTAKSE